MDCGRCGGRSREGGGGNYALQRESETVGSRIVRPLALLLAMEVVLIAIALNEAPVGSRSGVSFAGP